MKFELFSELYDQATQYDDCDKYIAERGWQDWMDLYSDGDDVSTVSDILFNIFDLTHMDIKKMRATLGLTFRAFSELYSIPSRTVQDWEYGKNKTPEYVRKLIAYTMLMRRIETEDK